MCTATVQPRFNDPSVPVLSGSIQQWPPVTSVTLLIFILEAPGSDLGRDTDYPDSEFFGLPQYFDPEAGDDMYSFCVVCPLLLV
jgi:hypothetical protein